MDNAEILKIIKKIAFKRAPSGLEKSRGNAFRDEIEKVLEGKNIPFKVDNLGNHYVKFKGTNKKRSLAIFAHLDEIGGTIRRIKKNGRLEFSKRGGYECRWLVSKKVQILNKDSEWVNGVIAGRSTHSTPEKLRVKEKIDEYDLEIYIGASNKNDAIESYKIHVGAPFVFSGEFDLLNPEISDDIISGYSMDNLVALTCLVLITQKINESLLNDFGNLKIPYDIYVVATAREEIGTEGALYFARNNSIDQVIAIDIGLVADFSGSVGSGIELKGGPVIVWQELRGMGVFDYDLINNLVEFAEKNDIKYQDGVVEFYGSDAGKVQKWLGIPSVLIGIPSMFSHNVPEISTLSEIEATADLILQYLKSMK